MYCTVFVQRGSTFGKTNCDTAFGLLATKDLHDKISFIISDDSDCLLPVRTSYFIPCILFVRDYYFIPYILSHTMSY